MIVAAISKAPIALPAPIPAFAAVLRLEDMGEDAAPVSLGRTSCTLAVGDAGGDTLILFASEVVYAAGNKARSLICHATTSGSATASADEIVVMFDTVHDEYPLPDIPELYPVEEDVTYS